MDLSDDDAAALLDANGDPLPNVGDAEIRRVLFGRGHQRGSPAWIRRDMLAVACRSRTPPHERCDDGDDNGGSGDGGRDGTTPGTEATLGMVKELLGELLTETVGFGVVPGLNSPRATAERIGQELQGLTLDGGPADSVALFDFERLFLASDLIVTPRPDRGRVSDFVDAGRLLVRHGGRSENAPRAATGDIAAELTNEAQLPAASDPFIGAGDVRRTPLMFGITNPFDVIEEIVSNALQEVQDRFAPLDDFNARLRNLRRADYDFTPFATDGEGRGLTMGLLVGYRQRWEPRGYQAGELVKTIPLGPKSVLRYTSRRRTSRSYTDKRAQASESTYSSEAQDVQRDIAKIVRDTKLSTKFSITKEAGGGVPGVGSGSSTVMWEAGAERTSSSTKESFREETRKHAEQLKQSSSVEITQALTEEVELEETSEISNPNEELVVTYLFYELQRRLLVSEQLHNVTPVVLVAHELPSGTEIDDAWIARYDWVVRRVLLGSLDSCPRSTTSSAANWWRTSIGPASWRRTLTVRPLS